MCGPRAYIVVATTERRVSYDPEKNLRPSGVYLDMRHRFARIADCREGH